MSGDWRPTCSLATLLERARALNDVRAFFAARDVLEVDTPVLSQTTVTDTAIESMRLTSTGGVRYLQTSPEYQMKRLLAAGAPSMVRIGPVFRAEESGRLHNPEFTMIEWYRLGFDLAALMDDVAALVNTVLGAAPYRRISYAQLLHEGVGVDVWRTDDAALAQALLRCGVEMSGDASLSRREALDLLAACAIELLGPGRVFVTDYPADQAALAKLAVDSQGRETAQRFELIIDGVEIANGYDELPDAQVLSARMASDCATRRAQQRAIPAVDERLLDALRHGLPACAGVALGFDRLLMMRLGIDRIEAVLPFSFERC